MFRQFCNFFSEMICMFLKSRNGYKNSQLQLLNILKIYQSNILYSLTYQPICICIIWTLNIYIYSIKQCQILLFFHILSFKDLSIKNTANLKKIGFYRDLELMIINWNIRRRLTNIGICAQGRQMALKFKRKIYRSINKLLIRNKNQNTNLLWRIFYNII